MRGLPPGSECERQTPRKLEKVAVSHFFDSLKRECLWHSRLFCLVWSDPAALRVHSGAGTQRCAGDHLIHHVYLRSHRKFACAHGDAFCIIRCSHISRRGFPHSFIVYIRLVACTHFIHGNRDRRKLNAECCSHGIRLAPRLHYGRSKRILICSA